MNNEVQQTYVQSAADV